MAQIRVQHFGPITDSGLIEIKKNTFFIGDQGSGKSTMAKLISTFSWFEKAINRGDFTNKLLYFDILNHLEYHQINNYLKDQSVIEYNGDRFQIKFDNNASQSTITEPLEGISYVTPKILYVPAERNLFSTLDNAFNIKRLPENLSDFAVELKIAQNKTNSNNLELRIGKLKYKYDDLLDESYIIGKDYQINLNEASSGLHSYTPLFLTSRYLSQYCLLPDLEKAKDLSPNQILKVNQLTGEAFLNSAMSDGDIKGNKVLPRFLSSCFINIVEEPEQNLFPDSQWEALKSLVEFNNVTKENKLIVTTHSPYIINYLALLVKGFQLHKLNKNDDNKNQLENLIPFASSIKPEDLVVYELNENDGKVSILDDYKGMPSDENFLNNKMGDVNDKFDQLLDIEEQCQ
ncbi:MAG: AAA family ATPase [Bacteroidales bacterium]|jgi:predicted ATPase|nr:AAA family ATPase [Bacteroidales bacterium]